MSDYELEHLSVKIGNWKPLARRLRFLPVEIEAFDNGNRELSKKVYRMLILWKQREGSGATYRALYNALYHPLINRKDLAEEFCCIYERSVLVST